MVQLQAADGIKVAIDLGCINIQLDQRCRKMQVLIREQSIET